MSPRIPPEGHLGGEGDSYLANVTQRNIVQSSFSVFENYSDDMQIAKIPTFLC